MQTKAYSYLALGDSYTIGESLPSHDNFPNQTARFLTKTGYKIEPLTIVAKTGWATHELISGIADNIAKKSRYDIVSLLIGVNNQYRGGDQQEYAEQFEELLQNAIQIAGNENTHVFVLSIPDWGATPYAEGRDRAQISKEIDSFNVINRRLSEKWKVNYIEITNGSREAYGNPSLIASDGLHPSAQEYKRWSQKLAEAIRQQPF